MIYRAEYVVSSELQEDFNQSNLDHKARIKDDLFRGLTQEIMNKNPNIIKEEREEYNRGTRYTAEIVAFSREEYFDKMKRIKELVDTHALISNATKDDILRILNTDNEIAKLSSIPDKVYI